LTSRFSYLSFQFSHITDTLQKSVPCYFQQSLHTHSHTAHTHTHTHTHTQTRTHAHAQYTFIHLTYNKHYCKCLESSVPKLGYAYPQGYAKRFRGYAGRKCPR